MPRARGAYPIQPPLLRMADRTGARGAWRQRISARPAARLDELLVTEKELTADRDDKLEQINAEIAQVTERRARIASAIRAELVALYDKQRSRYGIGAALLTRGVSGGDVKPRLCVSTTKSHL